VRALALEQHVVSERRSVVCDEVDDEIEADVLQSGASWYSAAIASAASTPPNPTQP